MIRELIVICNLSISQVELLQIWRNRRPRRLTEELLDRMLTRLALCDDSNLQALLSKLLPLTISSLSSSSSTSVRNKVIEILGHVNKRVKYQPDIALPLLDLWDLYMKSNASSPLVKNFCIIYLEMAFERAQETEKKNLMPVLVANISKVPNQHQEIILRIAAKGIGEYYAKGLDEETAFKYQFVDNSKDRELFIEFCLHLVLYQPQSQGGECVPGLSILLRVIMLRESIHWQMMPF
ncbi:hypothetical protein K2173_028394 [Erythroxylum novogranatense]|uniref:Proteasome component Ecm29 N-terminal domain-containing protein n=1 Tax=Erythroxylum novogranatense TaxID=1862640 RepID=A0AAV8U1Q4_9ROSI|nr:hypothetical protein K2173_028394 [Erythroxylum novogranatense]